MRDPEAVPQADEAADHHERDRNGDPCGQAILHEQRHDHGRDADDGANRQIDAGDQNDHRHADRDDADDRHLSRHVAQVARGGKGGIGEGERDRQDHKGDQRGVGS